MAEESEDGLVWDQFDYEIAECYVSGLINGDVSGLEDEDEKLLIQFETYAHNTATRSGWRIGHWDCGEEEDERYAECDVSGLFAKVVPVSLHVFKVAG